MAEKSRSVASLALLPKPESGTGNRDPKGTPDLRSDPGSRIPGSGKTIRFARSAAQGLTAAPGTACGVSAGGSKQP